MAKKSSPELKATALLARKEWPPLPAVVALHGDAEFFKQEVEKRFTATLFSDGSEPSVRRYHADSKEGGHTLAAVLDDLCTLSFMSPHRLVIIRGADGFLAAHRDALESRIARGFGGGHLILEVGSLDQRTRFARTLLQHGWVVSCRKPFDRPPPWDTRAPAWDNDLCRWVVAVAKGKGMTIDLELSHAFCQRVGTDLATLNEELEKLRNYVSSGGKRLDLAAVEAVAGELRQDSIFDLVDSFLLARRPESLAMAEKLFRTGYRPTKGSPVSDPTAIWSMFTGAVISRLRSLRRAHALRARGEGPESWIALRLTSKPFLPRFQRDLGATSLDRIERSFAALRDLDRAVKTGARAEPCLERFLLKY